MLHRERTPKVSVCIPTYNGATFLRDCLNSVLGQTFDDMEIVVVDDGSTDQTVSICEEYMRLDKRLRLFVNEKISGWYKTGITASRNEGRVGQFVFQDDIIMATCVSRMLEASRPDVDLVAVRRNLVFASDTPDSVRETYIKYVSEHNLTRYFADCSYISPENVTRLLLRVPNRNCIGEPTSTMVRKRAFAKFGYFNPNLVSLCDWEYFARIAANTGLCYIDTPLASFRVHAQARSAELRNHWSYIADTIDSLIVQYEMTYAKPYSSLRIAAANQKPPVRLKYNLAEAVRRARWDAVATQDSGRAKAELWRTLKRYPRMLMFPLGYLIDWGVQKLYHRKIAEHSKLING